MLISLDRFGRIIHWDVNTGKRLSNRSKNVNSYDVVTISQDGNTFATGNQQGKIYLWDSTQVDSWHPSEDIPNFWNL